ncbi:MAG TPA: hypothetical protein VIC51_11350 [Psychromonas sp.]
MALTIRTTESQDKLIAKLSNDLDIKTASKLIIHLLESYQGREEYRLDLESEINCLEHDLKESVGVISGFQSEFTKLISFSTKDFDSNLYKED